MTVGALSTLALVLFIFVALALVTAWAWAAKQWLLAIPLTVIFLGACVGLIYLMERWGPSV